MHFWIFCVQTDLETNVFVDFLQIKTVSDFLGKFSGAPEDLPNNQRCGIVWNSRYHAGWKGDRGDIWATLFPTLSVSSACSKKTR